MSETVAPRLGDDVAGPGADEEGRVAALRAHQILDTVPEAVFDDLAQLAAQICGTPMAAVSLVDRHRQWFKAAIGLGGLRDDRRYSFCSHAVARRSTLVVPDATADEQFATNPLVTGEPFVRSYAGAPLVSADGYALGALCVLDTVPRWLTRDQVSSLEILARQASLALQVRRQALELAESEQRYRLMAENSTDMVLQFDAARCVVWVSPSSRAVLGYEPGELLGRSGSVLIHPDDREQVQGELAAAFAAGGTTSVVTYRALHRDGRVIPVESTVRATLVAGQVAELQSATRDVSDRRRAESRLSEADRRFDLAMDHAPIGMGLVDLDGRWLEANRALAELTGRGGEDLVGEQFDELVHIEDRPGWSHQRQALLDGLASSARGDVRWVRADGTTAWVYCSAVLVRDDDDRPLYLVVQVQDITDRRRADDELARQATTDPLSGLPNRSVLVGRLRRTTGAPDRHRGIGVLFVDLDHFKGVNDSVGHGGGDELIRQVAARLLSATRAEDTVGRLGGDEFVVVCEDVAVLGHLMVAAGRVRASLRAPFAVGDRSVTITASIGVALGSEEDADLLLEHADAAMYRAKKLGRDRIEAWPGAPGPDAPRPAVSLRARRLVPGPPFDHA